MGTRVAVGREAEHRVGVLLAGCQKSVSGSFDPGLTIITVIVLCGPGLGYAGWCWLRRDQIRAVTPEQEYHQALTRWEERAAGHENAELARLVDAIAESLHTGTPDGSLADRAVDVWILQQLTGVLGAGGATPQRLAAAVRAALGHIAQNGLLSPSEQELIAGDLFPAAYRQQVTASLVRLDAVLGELAAHTGGGWPQKPGRYTNVAMDAVARSAAGEVLTALVMQWLTVQVSAATATVPAVIIAGADEISRAHAERLSNACEQRGVPLTFMFRHLRDDAARLIGGGTAAFMRLGNHTEAEQAAVYIGRRHTFVISS